MSRSFVAVAGPAGAPLGRWTQISDSAWQESKLDAPDTVTAYVVNNDTPTTAGSTTVRLRNAAGTVEVLIIGDTIQFVDNGKYAGEFLGVWEVNGQIQPPAAQSIPEPVADAGPPPMPGRQAPPPQKPVAQKMANPAAAQAQKAAAAPPPERRPRTKAPNCDKSEGKAGELLNAVKNSDQDGLKRLLDSNVDPDAQGQDGLSALYIVADKGKMKMVSALVEAGADVNLGKNGQTPLMVAHAKGHSEVLRVLMAAAFTSMENSVMSSTQSNNFVSQAQAVDDEVPDSAIFELREVTGALARLGARKEDTVNSKDGGSILTGVSAEAAQGGDVLDSEMMREEAVRDAMKTLVRVQKGEK